MSPDEALVLVFSAGAALVAWVSWYVVLLRTARLGALRGCLRPVLGAPVAGMVLLALVLRYFASRDVRDAPLYFSFYLVLGAAWVGLARGPISWLGIIPRDDVAERRNPAASWAVGGAVVGLFLSFAGANVGDGPGWWVVLFCAALSTGAFYVSWWLVEIVARVSEAVTVERDLAAGMRLGTFLIALGLILGRSVAGNWNSATATLRDFALAAWPALLLTAFEALVRPRARGGHARGALPGLAHLTFAIGYVLQKGWW
jgi:uncharacterized membrane protein YjfL (UPF0719 family)